VTCAVARNGCVFGLAGQTGFGRDVALGAPGKFGYFSDAAGSAGDETTDGTTRPPHSREGWHGGLARLRGEPESGAGMLLEDRIDQTSAGDDIDVVRLRPTTSPDHSTRD
jgi:hypothetical protein